MQVLDEPSSQVVEVLVDQRQQACRGQQHDDSLDRLHDGDRANGALRVFRLR